MSYERNLPENNIQGQDYNPEIIIVCMAFTIGGFVMGLIAAWLIASALM